MSNGSFTFFCQQRLCNIIVESQNSMIGIFSHANRSMDRIPEEGAVHGSSEEWGILSGKYHIENQQFEWFHFLKSFELNNRIPL